jgi:hypothetical protein
MALAGCTVKKSTPPALAGPSELGLSLAVQAIPDVLLQDGVSQSQVVVTARDATGQPVRNLSLRLDIVLDGTLADPGALSSHDLVTDTAGRATAGYTAPSSGATSTASSLQVRIQATPVGGDFNGAVARSVTIRLIPTGTIVPPKAPGTEPTADFVYSPAAPTAYQAVYFNASASKPGAGRTIVSYDWDFRPAPPQQGVMVSASFIQAGVYNVTLVVTDDVGQQASVTKAVTIK